MPSFPKVPADEKDTIATFHDHAKLLREVAAYSDLVCPADLGEADAIVREAADEIERLRDALFRLTNVIRMKGSLDYVTGWQAFQEAERVLKGAE